MLPDPLYGPFVKKNGQSAVHDCPPFHADFETAMTDAALASDAAPANPFIPKGAFAEKVTEVQHYTDRLFRFRITRPQSLRFMGNNRN